MTATDVAVRTDPYQVGRSHKHSVGDHSRSVGHGTGGPASKRIVVAYGFWIFLLSDIVMFSAFFAAFAVLGKETAGGPAGSELFERWRVGAETALLLLSSFTCGLGSVAGDRRNMIPLQLWMLITGFLGAAFLFLEIQEFADIAAEGAGPARSAFLSSFFALVGCHGLHVSLGLLWLGTMMAQIWVKGFRQDILRRLMCFNLFWHTLDIIWVAIFTVVYLMGGAK